jgi:hypothetical protein
MCRAGRVAQVVGVRLEGQAQQADGAAFQDEQLLLQLLDHGIALRGVDFERRLEQFARVIAVLARGVQQRADVLAEATAAPADAGR